MKHHIRHRSVSLPGPASRQRGVVLLFSLIALVVLLIAAVALVRSFNTSLFTAGNIAFKRDLQNQSERAVDKVLTAFRTGGGLDSPTVRAGDLVSKNYSAKILPVNAQGIPAALLDKDSVFAAAWTAPDIDETTEPTIAKGVRVRYVIDRMCATAGDEKSLGANSCVLADNPTPAGNDVFELKNAGSNSGLGPGLQSALPVGVVYRVSVRVDGPRNTQAFFQSTFTIPSS